MNNNIKIYAKKINTGHFFLCCLALGFYSALWADPICPELFESKINPIQDVLYSELAKFSPIFEAQIKNAPPDTITFNLREHLAKIFSLHLSKIFESSSLKERFSVLQNFPVADIMAAPGHRILRNPAQIAALTESIKKNKVNFSQDKILLNIITTDDGTILSVDLWNAHHRLVAYLNANEKNPHFTLGKIPEEYLEILVNSKRANGEQWAHFLPVAGINLEYFTHFKDLNILSTNLKPLSNKSNDDTVALSSNYSNYFLGSRATISDLQIIEHLEHPKIAIMFGTFDPIDQNELEALRQIIKTKKLAEVVLVPYWKLPSKPNLSDIKDRLNKIQLAIQNDPKINVYVQDSSLIIDQFSLKTFFERMMQLYLTKNIWEIVEKDSALLIESKKS